MGIEQHVGHFHSFHQPKRVHLSDHLSAKPSKIEARILTELTLLLFPCFFLLLFFVWPMDETLRYEYKYCTTLHDCSPVPSSSASEHSVEMQFQPFRYLMPCQRRQLLDDHGDGPAYAPGFTSPPKPPCPDRSPSILAIHIHFSPSKFLSYSSSGARLDESPPVQKTTGTISFQRQVAVASTVPPNLIVLFAFSPPPPPMHAQDASQLGHNRGPQGMCC